MKNLVVLFFAFVATLPFTGTDAQTISAATLTWTETFDFGGSVDIPVNIHISCTDGSIFASGHRHITVGETAKLSAALTKFSGSTKLWTVADSTANEAGVNEIVEIGDNVLMATMGGNFLQCRSSVDGSLRWTISPSEDALALTSYGDTIVAIEAWSYSPDVFLIDLDGNVIRTFPLGSNAIGIVTPQILGNYLWIASSDNQLNPTDGYLARYDMRSGDEIWRVVFPCAVKTYVSVDGVGNSYVGLTVWDFSGQLNDTLGFSHFELLKFDAEGNKLWETKWYGRPDYGYEGNWNNWMQTLSFSAVKNAVVVGGAVQTDSFNSGNRLAWLAIFNATTGKEFWSDRWAYSTGAIINQVNGAAFDGSGNLFVLGNTFTGSGTSNVGYLQKYSFPTISVITDPNAPAPSSFSLSQNYPNPFNPTTTIRFETASTAPVLIAIYDILGREIQILVDETLNAGVHEVRFDGSSLPSGTYFCRMVANGFAKTTKMILLK